MCIMSSCPKARKQIRGKREYEKRIVSKEEKSEDEKQKREVMMLKTMNSLMLIQPTN
jgi:hypothetical protein